LGALPEVSGGKTTIYPYIEDKVKHAQVFAEEVTKAIQKINHGQWDPQEQIKYINDNYSWEAVKQEWIKFHELL
jgi:hypothetical protein